MVGHGIGGNPSLINRARAVAEHIGGTLGVIPHLNPAPRKVYLINETNETTEELFAHERRLYEVQWLRMHGVNVIHGGENSLRFTPHFGMDEAELDLLVDMVGRALAEGPRREQADAA